MSKAPIPPEAMLELAEELAVDPEQAKEIFDPPFESVADAVLFLGPDKFDPAEVARITGYDVPKVRRIVRSIDFKRVLRRRLTEKSFTAYRSMEKGMGQIHDIQEMLNSKRDRALIMNMWPLDKARLMLTLAKAIKTLADAGITIAEDGSKHKDDPRMMNPAESFDRIATSPVYRMLQEGEEQPYEPNGSIPSENGQG